jgi:hypothetical protein
LRDASLLHAGIRKRVEIRGIVGRGVARPWTGKRSARDTVVHPNYCVRASAGREPLAAGRGLRLWATKQSADPVRRHPVLVDLDIAWFGKRWFFDNGDVGFTLSDGDRATTSLVARLNSDRVFFGKTNTRYVNLAYAGNGRPQAWSMPAASRSPSRSKCSHRIATMPSNSASNR